MKKIAIIGLLVLLAVLAMPAASAASDLVVDRVDPRYIFVDLNNSLFAKVTNQGDAASGPYNVSIEITNDADTVLYSYKAVDCTSLGSGASTDVQNLEVFLGYWTPTTPENVTINVTADCDDDVIEGSGEGNNTRIETRNTTGDCTVDDMLPDTCYGYRGQHPMTAAYDGTGKVIFTYGDSIAKGKIANFTIGSGGDKNQVDGGTAEIPGGATVKKAVLYVYYGWRDIANSPNQGADPTPDFEMSIDGGSTLTADSYYTDMKGWAGSNYQYGTIVYDVTANVTGNGDYQVVRSNHISSPHDKKGYDYAMVLMIIYDDCNGDTYSIAHGYDRLASLYWGYSRWQYYVSPENATTTATLTDAGPGAAMTAAKLLTVAIDTTDGTGTESQKVNDCPWDDGAWSKDSGSYLSFDRSDVTSCITPSGTDETVYFKEGWQQSGNGFGAINAILTVENKPNATVYFDLSDIRVPEYCNNKTVGVWINTTAALASGTIIFDYAPCCANVTSFTQDPVSFPGLPGEMIMGTLTPGRVKVDFATGLQNGFPPNIPVRIGNITIHCCNATDYCMTDLAWNCTDPAVNLKDALNNAITPVKYESGTFRCNIPDLVVTWVKGDQYGTNPMNYTVTCTVENIGAATASDVYASLMVDIPGVVETISMGDIPAGNTSTETFTSVIEQSGTVDNLTVCVDYDDTIVELDEDNNCMIGRYPGEIVISIQPVVTYVQPQDQFDVNVYVDTKGMEVYAVQYRLTYNTSVVRAETQTKDTFLGSISETMVVVNEIYQPHGEASYAETRKVSGGVIVSDNVTNIHFIAIGERGDTTPLTLDDIILSDADGVPIAYVIEDGSVEITENTPPVPVGVSKHRINNVAQKYQCISTLCSCSYDLDYPGKGGNISYIRWAFGDGQYGTSEGLPVDNCTCKEHKYESWQWDPIGDPNGAYEPFDVQLEVTDDGCPEITNSTNFSINVYIAGDANGDGEVNILDAVWVGKYWRAECECGDCLCDPCYEYLWNTFPTSIENKQVDGADLNNDCEINILDAVIIGANWRHTAW